jgi:predicted AAA+ superfamily ATPase
MYIKRYLKVDLPEGQSCFLWGARKTGKSTYLKEKFPDAISINLLQADTYQKYSQNPEKLREELIAKGDNRTVILDEVQKVPLLLDEVHYLIENLKGTRFILCGSSVRKLKMTGANLLGGRAWRYLFQPLCYPELKELNWQKLFNHGLIPSHYLATENTDKFLASYIYDYVLPEVQYEAQLRKRDYFARFLDVVGISNGEMIVYNNIARESGVDAKTVRTYFDIMEDMYLGYHLYPFKKKVKRQIITETPKFYLFDTGLANYLRRYKFNEMIGSEAGRAFEHYVFLELMAYKNLNEKRDEISYWRTKEGYEVDFIVQDQAFEVKISNNINPHHIKGLLQFSEEHNFKLNLICLESTKRIIKINETEITIWPIEEFLKELWAHKVWK